jgi:cytochrome c-type biogenesis protein CcmH
MSLRRLFAVLVLLAASPLWALHPKDFQSAEEEQRYRALAKELRCVMCQNQSLADSPAGVADDMRQQVLQQIRAGRSDAEIRDWFVARYGDFILYRPKVEPMTWALWFGPFLLLGAGALVIRQVLRRQRPDGGTPPRDDAQEW